MSIRLAYKYDLAGDFTSSIGVPGKFCTSEDETNWYGEGPRRRLLQSFVEDMGSPPPRVPPDPFFVAGGNWKHETDIEKQVRHGRSRILMVDYGKGSPSFSTHCLSCLAVALPSATYSECEDCRVFAPRTRWGFGNHAQWSSHQTNPS